MLLPICGAASLTSVRGTFGPPVFFAVAGIDLSTAMLGPLSAGKLVSGRTPRPSDGAAEVGRGRHEPRQAEQAHGQLRHRDREHQGQGAGCTVAGIVATPSGSGNGPLPAAGQGAGAAWPAARRSRSISAPRLTLAVIAAAVLLAVLGGRERASSCRSFLRHGMPLARL